MNLKLNEVLDIPIGDKVEYWEHREIYGKSIDEMIDFLDKEKNIVPTGRASLDLHLELQR